MTDKYLDRQYQRGVYDCFHFAREVWLDVAGEDLAERMEWHLRAVSERSLTLSSIKRFERLQEPVTPCLVVMQNRDETPHIGVYWKGRVLHLTESGVEYQPPHIASRNHSHMRFVL